MSAAVKEGNVKMRKLLVVDDRPEVLNGFSDALGSGYEVFSLETCIEAKRCLLKDSYDMLITNANMPAEDGGALIAEMHSMNPDMLVVAVSAEGSISNPAQPGIDDFICKPFTAANLKQRIDKAFLLEELRRENSSLRAQLEETVKQDVLLGQSDAIRDIREKIDLAAPTSAAVFITGESGTGKKLIAKAIHNASDRKQKPFIKINCASLPEALLESRLFGHERGALPGALDTAYGTFELADGGTVLLEEISAANAAVQEKLLRVVQDGELDRIGGTTPVRVGVRIITTTSCDLQKAIDSGSFREDLFLRLSVVPIEVPPLRDRREDIPVLIEHYIDKFARSNKRQPVKLTPRAMSALCRGIWKGNVRELENRIERAVIMGGGETLDEDFFCMDEADDGRLAAVKKAFGRGTIREMEKLMILSRLSDMNDNRTRAAKSLEISVRTLRNKLHEYNVKRQSPTTATPPVEREPLDKEEEPVPILA
jgi:DNA-binding NtrC family response regulator